MLGQVLEMVFVVVGAIVVLLMCVRIRRLSERDRNAAATAAFGLFLCARYSALISGAANWIFAIAVGFLMALLAYQSLNLRSEPQIERR
jgi:multisubunit Na+/H+ antiporter MnhB subunit